MGEFIEKTLQERRSLEKTLADLVAQYERKPSPELKRTIELIEGEIEIRKRSDPSRLAVPRADDRGRTG